LALEFDGILIHRRWHCIVAVAPYAIFNAANFNNATDSYASETPFLSLIVYSMGFWSI